MNAPALDPEEVRLAALRRYGVLDAPPAPDLEVITRLAAHISRTPAAVINLIDAERQYQAAAWGMERSEVPRKDSMCARTVMERALVHVPDARVDERFSENPFVTGRIGRVRLYVGSPLITPDGQAIGTLCVVDEAARSLEPDQLQALQDLADQVVSLLELRLRSTRLEGALSQEARIASELAASEERTRSVLESAFDAFLSVDSSGAVVEWNRAATRLLGFERSEVVGSPFDALVPEADRPTFEALLSAVRRGEGASAPVEVSLRTTAGELPTEVVAWSTPGDEGVNVFARDITLRRALEAERVRTSQVLEHMATHDPLTGLPNRVLLLDRLERSMDQARRRTAPPTIFFLDLDGFKAVNDTFGHDAGDAVLVEVGRRLRSVVRAEDTVARISGDEFVVLVEEVTPPDSTDRIAARLVAALEPSVVLAAGVARVGASVGTCVAAPDLTPNSVLHMADQAMYARKRSRR